jgi:hypothetical protein
MLIAWQAPQIFPPMIPFCSRSDSGLFTPKMPAIAGCFNFSRSPLYEKLRASPQYAPGPRRIPGWVGWRPETVDSEMGHEPLSTIVPLASLT